MAEKMRVHLLAKELGVPSKAILEKCRAEGLELKNHMAALSAGLEATIREWFSEGAHLTTIESSQRVDVKEIRKATRRKTASAATRRKQPVGTEEELGEQAVAVAEQPEAPIAEAAPPAEGVPSAPEPVLPAEAPPVEAEPVVPAEEVPAEAASAPAAATLVASAEPSEAAAPAAEAPEPPQPVAPAGPQNVPAPARLQGPRVVRVEPAEPSGGRPLGPRRRAVSEPTAPAKPPVGRRGRRKEDRWVPGPSAVDEEGRPRRAGASPRRGRQDESVVVGERLAEWRERDLIEREERLRAASDGGLRSRRARDVRPSAGVSFVPSRRRRVELVAPLALHKFCAATGLGMNQLVPKLMRDHNLMPNRNTVLDAELAELLAAEHGIELDIIRAKTALEELEEEVRSRVREKLELRPPVVAFLGHVDHGKTSLLDTIRNTRVAVGESGGITQHIGAYRLDRDGKSVTFLDTPGHEAFTAMRARGANLTDVVVLVVAADDGVMPQTVEAINHARAAAVPIVVALNKIDLPGVDVNKVLGQLAEKQLVPQEWGGDVDVIRTSATTGEGIDALVQHLATLSDLLELKADPCVPARGTVVEAEMKEGVGVSATVLVQEGTLRPGDIIVCGPACGRVRALTNDAGQRVEQAGPATPVAVIGLDELPKAGDRFYQLESLARTKAIAEEVRERRRAESLARLHKPRSLEDLFAGREHGEVPELNLIVRADVQGSVDALLSALRELPTEEVNLRFLHAGVGPITEGDVILAEASDATVVGFHVVPETGVQRLAELQGVEVRLYRVIYEVMDDIRRALEGLLEPERKEQESGRAEVRETFSVSKVGTVAGCYVVEGVIRRADFVRLIRDGRIVLPTEDDVSRQRHRQIESLRRFKDDAREVRAGLECGIKIEDFDDVKPGDLIEAYSIVEVARKL